MDAYDHLLDTARLLAEARRSMAHAENAAYLPEERQVTHDAAHALFAAHRQLSAGIQELEK